MRRGFSIIEVLVALSVLAMSVIVLGTAYVNVLVSYQYLSRDTRGDEEMKFAMGLMMAEPDKTKVEAGGEYDSPEGKRVRWKAVVTPTTTTDLFDVSFECELSDVTSNGPEKRVKTLKLLRPTWSDPTEREKLRTEARQRIEDYTKGKR